MNSTTENISLSTLDGHIISTLCYYDIFSYPLKLNEVYQFLGTNHTSETKIRACLERLRQDQVIFQFDEYYSLQNDASNVIRRKKGNDTAEKHVDIASRQGKFIARFPFVRAVLASGSFSKGYMDEKSDLDFFIITAPGRLWIARTLLVMYKRIFLFNSHRFFCVNYFVDANHLEIEEKNLFTATELATVIPLYGSDYYARLLQDNGWLKKFFPNFQARSVGAVEHGKSGWLKKLLEGAISFFGGNYLEQYFKSITLKRWEKLYRARYSDVDFEVAFKTKDYASKNHPNHYQRKVEKLYTQRLTQFDGKISGQWERE